MRAQKHLIGVIVLVIYPMSHLSESLDHGLTIPATHALEL